jgi:hypothetical protein
MFGTNSLTVERSNYLRIMHGAGSVPGPAKFSHMYGKRTISGSDGWRPLGDLQNALGYCLWACGQLLCQSDPPVTHCLRQCSAAHQVCLTLLPELLL